MKSIRTETLPEECQTTLADKIEVSGRGVHSGEMCVLTLLPADIDHGVRFVRTDVAGAPEIKADIEHVSEEPLLRQTVLHSAEDRDVAVKTVEHVLAALHGMGVDNARVEMTRPEPPILDGSADALATAIKSRGLRKQDSAPRRVFVVEEPISFTPEDAPDIEYAAWPSESLTVTYFLKYDHAFIGSQTATFRVDPESFRRDIAPARTFCTEEEVAFLRRQGLIKGGDPDNAIVVGRDRILNTELQWENELARHKMLDFIGDLLLVGGPIRGHVLSFRGGHHTNAQFIQYLRKEVA